MTMCESDPEMLSTEDDDLYYTPEDLLDLLRSNQLATVLGTISFLQEQGISVADWSTYLGGVFARGWDVNEVWSAEDFLDATIINLSVLGGEVSEAESAGDVATAVVAYLPDFDRVEGMGLEQINGDVIFDTIAPIAHACGLTWSWNRDGDIVRVRVAARPAS